MAMTMQRYSRAGGLLLGILTAVVAVAPASAHAVAPRAEMSIVEPSPTPSFDDVTERGWQLIAKDPQAHAGEAIVVYGVVTQFDAATGDDTFLAHVGSADMDPYDYPTNTLLTGAASDLADLVEGDEFQAQVIVAGSYSYDTASGGSRTVPLLLIDTIETL